MQKLTNAMKRALADEIADVLNDILLTDRTALQRLIRFRVECNYDLANHPTVQVAKSDKSLGEGEYDVGLLGILNGILEPILGCYVARVCEEANDETIKFIAVDVGNY